MKKNEVMKKLGITVLASMLMLTCAVPTVCPADAQETAADAQDSQTGEAQAPDQAAQQNQWNITTKTYEKEYKTEEGRVYKKISCAYPYAEGDSKAAQTFNQFYKKVFAKWKKGAQENLKDAEEVAKLQAEGFYTDEVTYEITNHDKNYISVLMSGYDYTMGAHGMPYRYTYTFDAKTGQKVSAANLLGISKKKLNEKVRGLYLKKFDKTQKEENDLFYQDRNDVEKALEKINFNNNLYYLKNGKIRFYTYPYEVGPYAAGFIEVAVKL